MDKRFICCMCGREVEGYGNNPYPVVKDEGARCCDSCNITVILARLAMAREDKETDRDD